MPRPILAVRFTIAAFAALALFGAMLAPDPYTREANAQSVLSMDAGGDVTCAVTSAGGVKCWGGLEHTSATPANVIGLSDVVNVSVGDLYACALTAAGSVKCWFPDFNAAAYPPFDITGATSGVASISIGGTHACLVTTAGGAKCWGLNTYGQLGDGTTNDNFTTPVNVSGLTSGVASISAGDEHTCAVTTGGALKCWGQNYYGQIGNGNSGGGPCEGIIAIPTPDSACELTAVTVTGLASGMGSVSAGNTHTCAAVAGPTGGSPKCWGVGAVGIGGSPSAVHATPVTVSLSSVVSVAAGRYHTCARLAAPPGGSGGLRCWDVPGGGPPPLTNDGQLGNGTFTPSQTPVIVTGFDMSGASDISAGRDHTCAMTPSSGIKCWGLNASGQLGDATTTNRNVPTSAIGFGIGPGNTTSIEAGASHTCMVTAVGGAQCWGDNAFGQLGNGTTTDSTAPVNVTGLTSGVASINAGGGHTCAITTAGALKCWGRNTYGQLGNGTTTNSSTPVNVTGLASGVLEVSAGGDHTCAFTAAAQLKCWGRNNLGQLGNGTTTNSSTPVNLAVPAYGGPCPNPPCDPPAWELPFAAGLAHTCAATNEATWCWGDNTYGQGGGLFPVVMYIVPPPSPTTLVAASLVAGDFHTCAVDFFGSVLCWGRNNVAQLGIGGPGVAPGLQDVLNSADMVSLSASGDHTCALTSGGSTKCWGGNSNGELGNGTTTLNGTPGIPNGMLANTVAVTAGGFHSCAIVSYGGVKCWGDNADGQLGDGTTLDRLSPVKAALGQQVQTAAVSAGDYSTCVLAGNGGVKCWGYNASGQLGNGTTTSSSTQTNVVGLSGFASQISAGASYACAVTTAGAAQCWGENGDGQLGDGTTTDRSAPVTVTGLASGVASVGAGYYHTCAVTTAGGVKCWGDNSAGQLGNGSLINSTTPVNVTGLASGVSAVAVGAFHTCALTTAGGIKCWGYNLDGELGNGTTTDSTTPVNVTGLTSGAARVTAGAFHSCAATTAGGAKCWGYNLNGELGNGTTASSNTPVNVTGLTSAAADVDAGDFHTCGLTTAGAVRCWGANNAAQLGNGTTTNSSAPVNVTGLTSGFSNISAGAAHSCALIGSKVQCWGYNALGQLGNGTTTDSAVPVSVIGKVAVDTDGDGCADDREARTDAGSEMTGGLRNFKNRWDFFDTDGNKEIDLFIDIFGVAGLFGADANTTGAGEPDGYDTNFDRSEPLPGEDVWDMHAPDGIIDLFTDIFGVAYQFGHGCT